tara:strand:+ start:178 stop:291 length:114 start_codon:yes stop_codon:yes gene_type:complete
MDKLVVIDENMNNKDTKELLNEIIIKINEIVDELNKG